MSSKSKTGTPATAPVSEDVSMSEAMETALRAVVEARSDGQHIALTVKDSAVKFGIKGGTFYTFDGPESARTFADVLKTLEASGLKVQDHPGRFAYALRHGAGVEIGKGARGPRTTDSADSTSDGATDKPKTPRKTGKAAAQAAAVKAEAERIAKLEADPAYWITRAEAAERESKKQADDAIAFRARAEQAKLDAIAAEQAEAEAAEAEAAELLAKLEAAQAKLAALRSKQAEVKAQIEAGRAKIAADNGLKTLAPAAA